MLLSHPPATPEKKKNIKDFYQTKSETPDKLCQKQSKKKKVMPEKEETKAKWQRTYRKLQWRTQIEILGAVVEGL
jgi:hypothetical protein